MFSFKRSSTPTLSKESESSSSRGRNPSPSASNSSISFVGPARPLRLVYCDENGKFRMDPEAVATLQLVKGPVGVVSVCGRARQGKSFILNQLLGRSSGFHVASTHRPCTKGLWMWSAPIRRTALDGTEYSLILLDTEGIDAYDQTGTYSTQIFSLAVLLSSMFVYNQMGGIDEAALDRLSLVTEMTKHIRVRASGGKTTASELGQFSPVFVWLLRDFYLDLTEDNRKITPRDYLEIALRPMEGGRRDLSAKNEIRESIRALFPDRECFALVRPLNNENDLQRLDQISLDKLRPEFRSGLDALTRYVFERTKPKQVGATVMTGPVLAGITQSFLDAINKGAVPTISSSWQSVEEAECRRAYDSATEAYTTYFDRTISAEEAVLREAHEDAAHKAVAIFNSSAVGAGSTRLSHEKKLQNYLKKTFEDYKKKVFLEADLQCSSTIQIMDTKFRAACHVPDAKVDDVVQVLGSLVSDYESSSYGPEKWKKLAMFLQQCLDGKLLDLFKKRLDKLESERTAFTLKCNSSDEKVALLKNQLEANEKHRSDYLRRYEEAISDKQKLSEDYSSHIANLQGKCRTLEERCLSLSKAAASAKQESSDWKIKYENSTSETKAEEENLRAQIASLESRLTAAEGRLAAAREQGKAFEEEALEWERKYDRAINEAKTGRERSTLLLEQANKKAQERIDIVRRELSEKLEEKDEEIKHLTSKLDRSENHASNLTSKLENAESRLKSYEMETNNLNNNLKTVTEKLDSVSSKYQSHDKEVKILEQEKKHLEERYLSESKKFEEANKRLKEAEGEAKRAIELADNARAEAVAAQKEKSEAQRLAMARLNRIERAEREVENLEREKTKLMEEIERLHRSEMDAQSKVSLLESRVDEREKEIEELMNQSNKDRSSTVQVLESLLADERAALAEATNRAEALSLQLQATQSKLDALQQEFTSVRLNETALDSKMKTSRGKRFRMDESVHEYGHEDERTRNRTKTGSANSPLKYNDTEDGGSTFRHEMDEDISLGRENKEKDSDDYRKFTVIELKQELTKHGFGGHLLQLKNPLKKEILALYEKHVLKI